MGIRVNKVLGYGFKYCKFNKDIRFNDWVFDLSHELHEVDIKSILIEKYKENKSINAFDDAYDLQWLTNTGWYKDDKPIKNLYLYNFLKYCSFSYEAGQGPIIFTSPANKDWFRHDDIIDYHESPNMETSVKYIPDGIYPMNAVYIDRRTGIRSKVGGSKEIIKECHSDYVSDDEFKSKFNVKSFNEFCVNIVPIIPSIIVNFCNIFNVFKNPLNVYRLKPMILTYWD